MTLELVKHEVRDGRIVAIITNNHPPIPDVLFTLRQRVLGKTYRESEPTVFYPRDVAWSAVLDLHRAQRHDDATALAVLLLWCHNNGQDCAWEICDNGQVDILAVRPLPTELVTERGWAPDMPVRMNGEHVYLMPMDGGVGMCCHVNASMFCLRHRTFGIDPNGCQHCGGRERTHCQQWAKPAGWHSWTAPTDRQRLMRMRARRAAREAGQA